MLSYMKGAGRGGRAASEGEVGKAQSRGACREEEEGGPPKGAGLGTGTPQTRQRAPQADRGRELCTQPPGLPTLNVGGGKEGGPALFLPQGCLVNLAAFVEKSFLVPSNSTGAWTVSPLTAEAALSLDHAPLAWSVGPS